MDEQRITNDTETSADISSSGPVPIDPSEPLPETLSPEEYLLKSKRLLDMDQPESPTNNFLLFSPLLPVIVFTILSLSVLTVFVNQRHEQVADIRSKAQLSPCAVGSDLACIKPGDSCGDNSICVNGQNEQNSSLCTCMARQSIPIPISPSPTPTQTIGIRGFEIVASAFGVTLLLLSVILWKRKKTGK